MGAVFASASSQRLVNTAPPFIAYPFSVGMWFKPADTGSSQNLFGMFDVAAASTRKYAIVKNNGALQIVSDNAAVAQTGQITIATAVGAWMYVVGRFISATNRRIAGMNLTQIVHAQQATSSTATALDNWSLGSREIDVPTFFFNGSIAEFWITNTDIQVDGAQLQNWLLQRLAYGGPFSVPHITKDIVEYRSLRVFPDSRGDRIGEVSHGRFGRQVWGNTNGVTMGDHPPLPYWYVKPGQASRNLVV